MPGGQNQLIIHFPNGEIHVAGGNLFFGNVHDEPIVAIAQCSKHRSFIVATLSDDHICKLYLIKYDGIVQYLDIAFNYSTSTKLIMFVFLNHLYVVTSSKLRCWSIDDWVKSMEIDYKSFSTAPVPMIIDNNKFSVGIDKNGNIVANGIVSGKQIRKLIDVGMDDNVCVLIKSRDDSGDTVFCVDLEGNILWGCGSIPYNTDEMLRFDDLFFVTDILWAYCDDYVYDIDVMTGEIKSRVWTK